jgi:hypothetical protein
MPAIAASLRRMGQKLVVDGVVLPLPESLVYGFETYHHPAVTDYNYVQRYIFSRKHANNV